MARIVDLVSGDRDRDGGTDYDLDGWRSIGGVDPRSGRIHEKTNYEGIIGKVVRITEKVDNLQQTGTAVVNGLEWTTRAERDDVILDPGDLAKVVNISGVKLIVKKYEEE